MSEKNIYEIMHMDRRVAKINDSGQCKIYYKSFMPYNLYLEEAEDIDPGRFHQRGGHGHGCQDQAGFRPGHPRHHQADHRPEDFQRGACGQNHRHERRPGHGIRAPRGTA